MTDAATLARRLLDNPLSERLADGWYPSHRNDDGLVVHDRHVLIWVRHYEHTIRDLLTLIDEDAA